MKKERRKLDHAALAFPAATSQDDTRVFQISCVITDTVKEEILREAAAIAVRCYPLFQCILKRGNFWFYFEKTKGEPIIRKMDDTPCQNLYHKKQAVPLYEITYGKHVINLEIFHALTDGTGAIEFLSAVIREYLRIRYELPDFGFDYPTQAQQEEDSFSRYYTEGKQQRQIRKSAKAFQIPGKKRKTEKMRVYEYTTSAAQLLVRARASQVSITVYMTAVFLYSIALSMTKEEKKKPVTIMVPINLRKFYPSRTMCNFFGWMEIEYLFREKDSFEDVLRHVKKRFSEDLQEKQVAARMNRYVKLEKHILMRLVPLGIKDIVLKWGTKQGSKKVTGVFSNMGTVKMPQSCRPYIRRFGAMASTDRIQMCACSYEDRFYFSITSKYMDETIPRNFLRFLRNEGLLLKEEKEKM